jgi:hypothetical protein
MIPSVKSQGVVALLGLILLSHASLSLHIATHTPVDQSTCEMCAGHGSLAPAASPARIALPPLVAVEIRPESVAAALPAAATHSYRERAPPVSA